MRNAGIGIRLDAPLVSDYTDSMAALAQVDCNGACVITDPTFHGRVLAGDKAYFHCSRLWWFITLALPRNQRSHVVYGGGHSQSQAQELILRFPRNCVQWLAKRL